MQSLVLRRVALARLSFWTKSAPTRWFSPPSAGPQLRSSSVSPDPATPGCSPRALRWAAPTPAGARRKRARPELAAGLRSATTGFEAAQSADSERGGRGERRDGAPFAQSTRRGADVPGDAFASPTRAANPAACAFPKHRPFGDEQSAENARRRRGVAWRKRRRTSLSRCAATQLSGAAQEFAWSTAKWSCGVVSTPAAVSAMHDYLCCACAGAPRGVTYAQMAGLDVCASKGSVGRTQVVHLGAERLGSGDGGFGQLGACAPAAQVGAASGRVVRPARPGQRDASTSKAKAPPVGLVSRATNTTAVAAGCPCTRLSAAARSSPGVEAFASSSATFSNSICRCARQWRVQ